MKSKETLIKTRKRYASVMNFHGIILVLSSIIFVVMLVLSMLNINDFFSFYYNTINITIILFILLTLIFFNGYYFREMYLNVDNIDLFYLNYSLLKKNENTKSR